jgi:hypothetical protein
VITAVGGTENNMKLVVEAPSEIADTEMITVKVKVGKYTKTGVAYTPETMGQWRTQIVAQTNTPIGDQKPDYGMQDMVEWRGHLPDQSGRQPVYETDGRLGTGHQHVDGLDSTLASSTQVCRSGQGLAHRGHDYRQNPGCPAPKTFTLNLEMTTDNRVALKEVAWQESTDNGDTWTSIEKSNTIRHNIGMQEPGKRQVRARMVNKNTLAESFTAPVEVWAYSTLDAQITGPRHMAPGYTATLASELYREGVLTANTVNEWKIEAPSGTTVTATGATATITEEQEGKVYITLKTRPADTRAMTPTPGR